MVIMFVDGFKAYIDKDWLAKSWNEITEGNQDHLAAGTSVERARSWKHTGGYFSKTMAYIGKDEAIGMYYLECIKCGCHAEATSPSIWDWLEETDGLQVVMERNFIDPIKSYLPEDCVIIYGPDDEDLNRGHRLIDPDKPDELSMLGLIEHLQQTDRSFRIKVPDENGNGYKEISALEMLEQVRQAESVTRSKEKIKILEV